MKESCIEFTLPFDASVVATAHSDDWSVPYRSSLPSMFGAAAEMPAARIACEDVCSYGTVNQRPAMNSTIIAAKMAHPWRMLPTILPNV